MVVRKNKNQGDEFKVDPNTWMATFSDLLMLLLTFFVLLLTMKSMDTKAYKKIFDHMLPTSGPLEYKDISGKLASIQAGKPYGKPVLITSDEMIKEAIDFLKNIDELQAQGKQLYNLRDYIEITEDNRGVIIALQSDNLFEPGEAEIKPDMLALLDKIEKIFRYASNDILIMGHTDNLPLKNSKFESNWELSFYRALSVLFYLSDSLGIKPERLAAGGYGDLMPRYPNDTQENRIKNRRVEFILKDRRKYCGK